MVADRATIENLLPPATRRRACAVSRLVSFCQLPILVSFCQPRIPRPDHSQKLDPYFHGTEARLFRLTKRITHRVKSIRRQYLFHLWRISPLVHWEPTFSRLSRNDLIGRRASTGLDSKPQGRLTSACSGRAVP